MDISIHSIIIPFIVNEIKLNKISSSDLNCLLLDIIIYCLFDSKAKDEMTVGFGARGRTFSVHYLHSQDRFDPVYHCCN